MRVEPFGLDSYVHVVKRGARGMPITGDTTDRERFVDLLYYMNDEYLDENWHFSSRKARFFREETWPKRAPIVSIIAYTLMPNHLHLILKEIREGGVSMFMKRIGQSMTNHYNEKYNQHGSLFQGSYRARTIENDEYLRYACAYVMVKNVYEVYPKGGLKGASQHFAHAWKWATTYPFSSLREYAGGKPTGLLDDRERRNIFATPVEFENFAADVIAGGKWTHAEFE